MATNLDQVTSNYATNAAALMPTKVGERSEKDKKKVALGDIKNAPSNSHTQINAQKVESEEVDLDFTTTSLKPVDYFQEWIEKAALSDEEVNKWVRMLRTAHDMNPNEETMPPRTSSPPMPSFCAEEYCGPPPPLLMSPDLSSSEYHSFDGEFEDDYDVTQPTSSSESHNFYNDSELSALNKSVFELSTEDSFWD